MMFSCRHGSTVQIWCLDNGDMSSDAQMILFLAQNMVAHVKASFYVDGWRNGCMCSRTMFQWRHRSHVWDVDGDILDS